MPYPALLPPEAWPWRHPQAPSHVALAGTWRAWEAALNAHRPAPPAAPGLPSGLPLLMQGAIEALGRWCLALRPHTHTWHIVAGHGLQGADGLGLAAWLHHRGRRVEVHLPREVATSTGGHPPRLLLRHCESSGLTLHRAALPPAQPLPASHTWVDALWGCGFDLSRPLPSPDQPWLQHWQSQHTQPIRASLLSIDLPSGLCPDTGSVRRDIDDVPLVAPADATLTLLGPKLGLCTGEGPVWRGQWWLSPLTDAPRPEGGLLLKQADPEGLKRLAILAHKGHGGQVAVWRGEDGMAGAAELAARAALRAGAGRVYLVGGTISSGAPHEPALMQAQHAPQGCVEVLGCGGGQLCSQLLPSVAQQAAHLVLDADALNALAREPALQALVAGRGASRPTVVTPHPLEAARLLGCGTEQVQSDRLAAAQALAGRLRCVVVLKGPGTVIASPEGSWRVNGSGHPVLATAGSGDVLAGWIAACWAQRLGRTAPVTPWEQALEAACSATWAHGEAAEDWARRHPALWQSMVASDLLTPAA